MRNYPGKMEHEESKYEGERQKKCNPYFLNEKWRQTKTFYGTKHY